MYSKLLAGYVNPDTITNPVLGPKLQGFIGHFGDSPAAFFQLFLPKLLTLGLIIGVIFFFFVLVMGAISWISSGGDKNALEAAKGKITNAIVGIVILFAVFAVIKVIENFFGISILVLDIGPLAM